MREMTCKVCKIKKGLDDLHQAWRRARSRAMLVCKDCHKAHRALLKNTGAKRKYKEKTMKSRAIVARKKWRSNNRDKMHTSDKRYKDANKHKTRCHTKVANALKSGYLIKPSSCTNCLLIKPLDAHHHDYDKPLDVT